MMSSNALFFSFILIPMASMLVGTGSVIGDVACRFFFYENSDVSSLVLTTIEINILICREFGDVTVFPECFAQLYNVWIGCSNIVFELLKFDLYRLLAFHRIIFSGPVIFCIGLSFCGLL